MSLFLNFEFVSVVKYYMIIGSNVSLGFVTEIRNGLQRFCVPAFLPLGLPLQTLSASAGGTHSVCLVAVCWRLRMQVAWPCVVARGA